MESVESGGRGRYLWNNYQSINETYIMNNKNINQNKRELFTLCVCPPHHWIVNCVGIRNVVLFNFLKARFIYKLSFSTNNNNSDQRKKKRSSRSTFGRWRLLNLHNVIKQINIDEWTKLSDQHTIVHIVIHLVTINLKAIESIFVVFQST